MGHSYSTSNIGTSAKAVLSINDPSMTSPHKVGTFSSKPSHSDKNKSDSASNNRKKLIRLGTIRRKLTRSLRTVKNLDHRKHIRDLLQTCTVGEIKSLLREYDGIEALKGLTRLSNNVRQHSNLITRDLEILYDKEYCWNLCLRYKNRIFKVHTAILCSRCDFFTKYLPKDAISDRNKPVELHILAIDLNVEVFSSLLKYVYCGYSNDASLLNVLSKLGEQFGILDPVKNDMKALLDKKDYVDLVLVFKNKTTVDTISGNACHTYVEKGDSSVDNMLEFPCHASVLCSRSAFFESVLVKTFATFNNRSKPLKLVLNEHVLPRPYMKVILNCFYTDTVVLDSIIKLADDGSGEADRLLTISELAMELYEIGCFLEFPVLKKGCEDIITSQLNVSSLLSVLEWSSQPFGSLYVHRQAMEFFQDEFYSLCKTSVFLANIPKKFLLRVIKSDFLQANEEFILATVIKWGEWQVVKSNEQPGTSPGNSLLRRSPKRRDVNNGILRDTISDLLPHIRLKHILPANSSVLNTAYQRGLLQRPFPFDVVASEKQCAASPVYWLRSGPKLDYLRPRLFLPYVYEVKLVLHERLCTASDHDMHASSYYHSMPDMLLPLQRTNSGSKTPSDEELHSAAIMLLLLDSIQIEQTTRRQMILREKELKMSTEVLKALSLLPDSREISEEVQLRVVREFGYPDEIVSKIFQQVPDLIEDSENSSNSSKHSTLSKVGQLFKQESNVLRSDVVNTPDECASLEEDIISDVKFIMDRTYENLHVDNSSVRSVEDSPLDLPLREQRVMVQINNELPNVLMDT